MNYTKGEMGIVRNDEGDFDVTVHDNKMNRDYTIASFGSYDNAQLFVASGGLYETLRTLVEALHANEFGRAASVAATNGFKFLLKAEGK
jgi:hypothetical protein